MTRPASVTTALSMLREARGEATIPDRMAWDLAHYVVRLELAATQVLRSALDDADGAPGTVALADLRDALPSPAQAAGERTRLLTGAAQRTAGERMPCGRETMCAGVCACVPF